MPNFLKADQDAYFPMPIPGYQMLGLLGQGAAGLVFKAKQLSTDQFVAIKFSIDAFAEAKALAQSHARKGDAQKSLAQECRVLALLAHPNVVRLIDQGSVVNTQSLIVQRFMVLEYLPDSTLRNFLYRQGALSLVDTVGLMAQLLDALALMHQKGIVHGDLKPENIMVTSNGCALHLKIVDFGLAGDPGAAIAVGAGAGTPAYCAPEQLRGERCTLATDIYAWALIFLECLSAKPCAQGCDASAVIAQQLNASVALPEVLTETFTGQLIASLLQRALQKEVHQRSHDAIALYAELVKIAAQLRASVAPKQAFVSSAQSAQSNHPTLQPLPNIKTLPVDKSAFQNRAGHSILCIRLHVVPARDASVSLSLLNEIQQEQMQWCVNTVGAGLGEFLGKLGESAVFHFKHACFSEKHFKSRESSGVQQDFAAAQNIALAARVATDLHTGVQRRGRLLELQHGVRVVCSAALHHHPASDAHASLNQAVNITLNLLSMANPGAILTGEAAQRLCIGL